MTTHNDAPTVAAQQCGMDAVREAAVRLRQSGLHKDAVLADRLENLSTVTPAEVGGLVERLDRLVDAQIDDNLEYIRAADEAMSEAASLIQSQAAESAADKARIAELEKKLADERHRATNAEYFNVAYRNMLGPVGVKVAEMWREKNVRRIHFDWGPEAVNLTGEERAQIILDMENMPSREVDDIDNDGKGPRTSAARRLLNGERKG